MFLLEIQPGRLRNFVNPNATSLVCHFPFRDAHPDIRERQEQRPW
jgi:hypothetical protein